jgi:hypothetical protein
MLVDLPNEHIAEFIGQLKPEQIFNTTELGKWARNNGWLKQHEIRIGEHIVSLKMLEETKEVFDRTYEEKIDFYRVHPITMHNFKMLLPIHDRFALDGHWLINYFGKQKDAEREDRKK